MAKIWPQSHRDPENNTPEAPRSTRRRVASRRAFQALPAADRDALIEFLKTLQALPPGTKDRIVDEKFHARVASREQARRQHGSG